MSMRTPQQPPTDNVRSRTVPTPDGPFTIVAGPHAVLASGWTTDPGQLVELIHPSLRPQTVVETSKAGEAPGTGATDPSPDLGQTEVLDRAVRAVAAYYAGDLAAPARIPVEQASGPFREAAWRALRLIAPGHPLSYAEFAAAAGRPTAIRAAASACAKNAAALFVPCHRVLRTGGQVGQFRWGPELKRSLLTREAGTPMTKDDGL
jgi:O-6-methylguanine DNA methyltransferase